MDRTAIFRNFSEPYTTVTSVTIQQKPGTKCREIHFLKNSDTVNIAKKLLAICRH